MEEDSEEEQKDDRTADMATTQANQDHIEERKVPTFGKALPAVPVSRRLRVCDDNGLAEKYRSMNPGHLQSYVIQSQCR